MGSNAVFEQVPFDLAWIGETGYMTEALDLIPENSTKVLVGYQICHQMPDEALTPRRRHAIRSAWVSSTQGNVGSRPLSFKISHQRIEQEVRGLVDSVPYGRRINYNGRAIITPHQIVVKVTGEDHQPLPVGQNYDTIELWLPYVWRNSGKIQWLQSSHYTEHGTQLIPKYHDGFHRVCQHLINALIKMTAISFGKEPESRFYEKMYTQFLIIEREHERCARDIQTQAKRTRPMPLDSETANLHGTLQSLVHQNRHRHDPETLFASLRQALQHYYRYVMASKMTLCLSKDSPLLSLSEAVL